MRMSIKYLQWNNKEDDFMSGRIIAINRMLGSNGRIIGQALAEDLGIAFYDKELI